MTAPDGIVAGPSQRERTAAGIVIVGSGPPLPARLRRLLPVLPYGAVAIVSLKRLPDP